MRVFVQGSSSEPVTLLESLMASPDACAGVQFIACQIPGLNRIDFAGLHPDARFTGLFITPEIARSYEAGKVRFMPLSYSSMYRYLEADPVDAALIQVTPTDQPETFSLGTSAHFVPAILKTAKVVIAEINDDLPSVGRSVSIDKSRLDYLVPTAHALLALDPSPPSETSHKIAAYIANLVRDGDHVQIGIGRVPSSILDALRSHRRLACHGGLISDTMIDLYEAGTLDPAKPLVGTSVIGTKRLYDWARGQKKVHVLPVCRTHDVRTLADLKRLVAINSVLAVDIGGQANAETVNGRQVGGCGGLPDFVRGAQLSRGGRSILALPSTARGGSVSRIIPNLNDDIASCSRVDADYVVTEHGVAELKHKSLDERAHALIEIADPRFRHSLFEALEHRMEGRGR
jgi:acyl-CoA hydrolase